MTQPNDPPKVLVVDDDPAFRHLVHLALDKRHVSVVEAGDGHDALRALYAAGQNGARARFSAVVTDFQMPRMTGLELVEMLAAAGVARQTILLSAFLDTRSQDWARTLGVAAVLRKPLDFDELSRTVVKLIRSPAPQKPRSPNAG